MAGNGTSTRTECNVRLMKHFSVTGRINQHFAILSRSLYKIDTQVNLLSCCIVLSVLLGWLPVSSPMTHVNTVVSRVSIIVAFVSVVLLNSGKQFDSANVLFYVLINIIALLSFRSLPGEAMEPLLIYLFLFSLIVFLFQKLSTRIICAAILIFRIVAFEIHYFEYDRANAISDAVFLVLIVLVLSMYTLKQFLVDKIHQKNELFTTHIIHDVQVSYHAVAAMIAYLDQSTKENKITYEEAKELVKKMSNASRLCAFILNNYLEYARKKRNIEDNHFENVDLTSQFENIVGHYQYLAAAKNIQIQLKLDDSFPGLVVAEKMKVTRIFINILENAIKNTRPGKSIVISTMWQNGNWELMIMNDGDEQTRKEIERLLNLSAETNSQRGDAKLGLGLPIAKEFARALGGEIKVTSDAEQKTIFTVSLPVKQ